LQFEPCGRIILIRCKEKTVMSAWVLVIAGFLVWVVGQRIPPPRDPASIRVGWLVCVLGVGIFVIGVYAGLKGPVSFGPVAFSSFSFAHAAERSNMEALAYARGHLQVSSHPAAGWHGASKSDLDCVVVNRGERTVTALTFRFATTDGKGADIRVRGPYPAKASKTVLVTLPDNALRNYFEAPGMSVNQLSGAAF
jgi:hypothetical protein